MQQNTSLPSSSSPPSSASCSPSSLSSSTSKKKKSNPAPTTSSGGGGQSSAGGGGGWFDLLLNKWRSFQHKHKNAIQLSQAFGTPNQPGKPGPVIGVVVCKGPRNELQGLVVATPRVVERYLLDGRLKQRVAIPEPLTCFVGGKIGGVGRVLLCGTQRGRIFILKAETFEQLLELNSRTAYESAEFLSHSHQSSGDVSSSSSSSHSCEGVERESLQKGRISGRSACPQKNGRGGLTFSRDTSSRYRLPTPSFSSSSSRPLPGAEDSSAETCSSSSSCTSNGVSLMRGVGEEQDRIVSSHDAGRTWPHKTEEEHFSQGRIPSPSRTSSTRKEIEREGEKDAENVYRSGQTHQNRTRDSYPSSSTSPPPCGDSSSSSSSCSQRKSSDLSPSLQKDSLTRLLQDPVNIPSSSSYQDPPGCHAKRRSEQEEDERGDCENEEEDEDTPHSHASSAICSLTIKSTFAEFVHYVLAGNARGHVFVWQVPSTRLVHLITYPPGSSPSSSGEGGGDSHLFNFLQEKERKGEGRRRNSLSSFSSSSPRRRQDSSGEGGVVKGPEDRPSQDDREEKKDGFSSSFFTEEDKKKNKRGGEEEGFFSSPHFRSSRGEKESEGQGGENKKSQMYRVGGGEQETNGEMKKMFHDNDLKDEKMFELQTLSSSVQEREQDQRRSNEEERKEFPGNSRPSLHHENPSSSNRYREDNRATSILPRKEREEEEDFSPFQKSQPVENSLLSQTNERETEEEKKENPRFLHEVLKGRERHDLSFLSARHTGGEEEERGEGEDDYDRTMKLPIQAVGSVAELDASSADEDEEEVNSFGERREEEGRRNSQRKDERASHDKKEEERNQEGEKKKKMWGIGLVGGGGRKRRGEKKNKKDLNDVDVKEGEEDKKKRRSEQEKNTPSSSSSSSAQEEEEEEEHNAAGSSRSSSRHHSGSNGLKRKDCEKNETEGEQRERREKEKEESDLDHEGEEEKKKTNGSLCSSGDRGEKKEDRRKKERHHSKDSSSSSSWFSSKKGERRKKDGSEKPFSSLSSSFSSRSSEEDSSHLSQPANDIDVSKKEKKKMNSLEEKDDGDGGREKEEGKAKKNGESRGMEDFLSSEPRDFIFQTEETHSRPLGAEEDEEGEEEKKKKKEKSPEEEEKRKERGQEGDDNEVSSSPGGEEKEDVKRRRRRDSREDQRASSEGDEEEEKDEDRGDVALSGLPEKIHSQDDPPQGDKEEEDDERERERREQEVEEGDMSPSFVEGHDRQGEMSVHLQPLDDNSSFYTPQPHYESFLLLHRHPSKETTEEKEQSSLSSSSSLSPPAAQREKDRPSEDIYDSPPAGRNPSLSSSLSRQDHKEKEVGGEEEDEEAEEEIMDDLSLTSVDLSEPSSSSSSSSSFVQPSRAGEFCDDSHLSSSPYRYSHKVAPPHGDEEEGDLFYPFSDKEEKKSSSPGKRRDEDVFALLDRSSHSYDTGMDDVDGARERHETDKPKEVERKEKMTEEREEEEEEEERERDKEDTTEERGQRKDSFFSSSFSSPFEKEEEEKNEGLCASENQEKSPHTSKEMKRNEEKEVSLHDTSSSSTWRAFAEDEEEEERKRPSEIQDERVVSPSSHPWIEEEEEKEDERSHEKEDRRQKKTSPPLLVSSHFSSSSQSEKEKGSRFSPSQNVPSHDVTVSSDRRKTSSLSSSSSRLSSFSSFPYVGALLAVASFDELWIGYGDGTIAVYVLTDYSLLFSTKLPAPNISRIEFSKYAEVVLVLCGNELLSVWNPRTLRCLCQVPAYMLTCGVPLAFLYLLEGPEAWDSRVTILLAGCMDGSISVRRLEKREDFEAGDQVVANYKGGEEGEGDNDEGASSSSSVLIQFVLIRNYVREVEPQVPISTICIDSWLNAAFVGDASGVVFTLPYIFQLLDPSLIPTRSSAGGGSGDQNSSSSSPALLPSQDDEFGDEKKKKQKALSLDSRSSCGSSASSS